MLFQLEPVETLSTVSYSKFNRDYFKPGRPVLLKGAICRDWPAYEKWTFEYLKQTAGDMSMPLIDNAKPGSDAWAGVSQPVQSMSLAQYIDLIETQPTSLHVFAFNILRRARMLCDDFRFPDHLIRGVNRQVAYLFVGGVGTITNLHYDPDLDDLLQTQFGGRKRILLFAPSESTKLYRLPWLVQSPIDPGEPDFARYPRAREARGVEVCMEHGDTLFIPSGWWHYMEYPEPSFALTLRAPSRHAGVRLRGYVNILDQFVIDNFMHRVLGPKWFRRQLAGAQERAGRDLAHAQRRAAGQAARPATRGQA